MISNSQRSINSFGKICKDYDYFIFDCDGVIWKGGEAIKEAVDAVKNLLDLNKKVYFLSNNNKVSRYDLKEKFKTKCGLDVDIKFIYNSGYLIAKYISDNYPEIKHLFLIGSPGLERELVEKGFIIYGGKDNKNIKFIENFTSDQANKMEINENIQACLVGYDEYFNYFKINYAMQVVNKTGLLFGTNYDKKLNSGEMLIAGAYTFIAAIETCTETEAIIITKPDPRSLKLIMTDHGVDLENNKKKMLMIGDNLNTDILFANNNEIDSVLVLTGVTTEEDLKKLNGFKGSPTYILNNLKI